MKKTKLISKYEHRLRLKNYSERTIQAYLNGLHIFIHYLNTNKVEEVTVEVLESFFNHCKTDLEYGYSMMKQVLASVRFLYVEVLNQHINFNFNIKMKKPSRIPVVLSAEEVQRFLNSFSNLKHKAIFTLLYSAGLRVGELLGLKIRDIDSDRMQIRIHQGKGKKDRYSVLSEKVLVLLREYAKEFCPKDYLFEGQGGGKYSASSI